MEGPPKEGGEGRSRRAWQQPYQGRAEQRQGRAGQGMAGQGLTYMLLILITHGLIGVKAQVGISDMFINDAITHWAANDPVFIIQGDVSISNLPVQNTMANFITYNNNTEEILTYIR